MAVQHNSGTSERQFCNTLLASVIYSNNLIRTITVTTIAFLHCGTVTLLAPVAGRVRGYWKLQQRELSHIKA